MESYYSSDEDFAWGPLTAREVKSSLKFKQKKIDRRHSACVLLPEVTNNTLSSTDSLQDKTKSPMSHVIAVETSENTSNNFLSKLNDMISSVSTCPSSNNDTYYTTEGKDLEKVELDTSSDVYESDISCTSAVSEANNETSFVYPSNNDIYYTTEGEEREVYDADISGKSSVDVENSVNSDYGEYNDTLDEINRLLQYEADQKNTSPNVNKNSVENLSFHLELPVTPLNIISASFLSADKNLDNLQSSSRKKKGSSSTKSEIPVKTLFAKTRQEDNFKVPKPVKTPSFNYKNVVSPVAVYINNTPSPCLKQNINAKSNKTDCMPLKLFDKPGESNISSAAKKTGKTCLKSKIPEVIYKPAKTSTKSYEEVIRLPENIKKHVSEKKLIVHTNRIKNIDLSETYISRKLMENNFTDASINVSNISESLNQDISVITEKQVIIEKKRPK